MYRPPCSPPVGALAGDRSGAVGAPRRGRQPQLRPAASPDVAVFDPPLSDRHPRAWALWAAARPSQVALVALVYALGVGMALAGPPLVVGTAPAAVEDLRTSVVVGLLALLPVTVAVHYANEYVDADTDARTDPTPFSGGSGALRRTGLPRAFLGRATALATLLAVLALAVAAGGPLPADALVLLAAILVAGLAYSLPPFALVRRGVGEVVNAVLGGLLLPVYGAATVGAPTPAAALAVLPFTLLVGCNLLATHWPDREADAAVGKRTLAVRWGPPRLRRVYGALAVGAGVATALQWAGGLMPGPVAAAHLVPLPALVYGGHVLTRQRSPLPAVAAMVALALSATVAWWFVGIGW